MSSLSLLFSKGYAAAKQFAQSGAKVILACRNSAKGSVAAAKIRNETKNSHVTFDHLDLGDFKSIESFAQRVDKCHVLVNNAGEIIKDRKLVYGIESTMLSNYVGHWYLTKLLLPKLAQTSIQDKREVRIVNVCSRGEKYSDIGPDYLENGKDALDRAFQGPSPYQPFLAYSNSKFFNLLFHKELSRRLVESPLSIITLNANQSNQKFNLTATAVTPGFANTNIFKFAPSFMTNLTAPLRYFTLKTADDGGSELLYAAIAEKGHGVYYGEKKPTASSDYATNKELSNDLWKLTDSIVQKIVKGEK